MRTRIKDKNVVEFPVTAYPLGFTDKTNEQYIKGDRGFAIVRTDINSILKTVKSDYILVRHNEVFNSIETALDDLSYELHDILFFGEQGASISIRYIIPNIVPDIDQYEIVIEVVSSFEENVPSTVSLGVRHPIHDCEFFGIKTVEIKPGYLKDGTVSNGIIKAVKAIVSAIPDQFKAIEELFRHWIGLSCEPTSVTTKIFTSGKEAGRFINSGLFSKVAKGYGDTQGDVFSLAMALGIFAIHYQTDGNKIIELQDKIIPKLKQLFPIVKEKE